MRSNSRPPQVRCESCGKLSDKAKGRPRRFCSDACRSAAHRAGAGFDGSHDALGVASRNGLKNPSASIACKANKPDPYPSAIGVPIDVLGRGYRWPGALPLDREIWAAILRREGAS